MANITNLNKSSPENFELLFPVLPNLGSLKESNSLSMNVFSSVLPTITLDTREQNWMGGKANWDSGGISYEPWYVNFLIDDNFDNWKILYNWINYINNNKDRYGRDRPDYVVDASLNILNNMRESIMTINFKNVWPSMLGEISMSYREGEVNLASSVNFMYDRYEIETP
jgi:hypothetical protein